MAMIPLRNRDGFVVGAAIVDDADHNRIARHRWSLMGGNPRRTVRIGERYHTVLMHREVMGATIGDGLSVEHVNGDKLDNRRENLRVRSAVPRIADPRPVLPEDQWEPDTPPDVHRRSTHAGGKP